jgi:hypothetical protein
MWDVILIVFISVILIIYFILVITVGIVMSNALLMRYVKMNTVLYVSLYELSILRLHNPVVFKSYDSFGIT